MYPESTRFSAGLKYISAVLCCLVPAIVLFLIDQIWTLVTCRESPYIVNAAVYMAVFFLLGVFGAGIARLLAVIRNESFALLILICTGAAYCFVLAVLSVDTTIRFFVENTCLVVFIMSFIWFRKGALSGPRVSFVLAALLVITVSWAMIFPERGVFAEPYSYFADAVFLGLLLGLIFELRLALARSIRLEMAALPGLVVLILLVHLAADYIFYPDGYFYKDAQVWTERLRTGGRPNIIFIVLDTVRRDRMSVYGYDRRTTPYLEELAKSSMKYTRAVSVSPWTLPSHASMFMGVYPRTHGSHYFYHSRMEPDHMKYFIPSMEHTTLAEIMTRLGYRCGAVSANYTFVGPRVNLDQGFEYFNVMRNPQFYEKRIFELTHKIMEALQRYMPAGFEFNYMNQRLSAWQVNARALEWIDSIERDKSFFLFLNYMDAHWPYLSPANFSTMYPGYDRKVSMVPIGNIWLDMIRDNRAITGCERDHLSSQYDASISYLDTQMRLLADELERRGLFDSSFIIITSDHGEFLGEHDLVGHGNDVYSEVIDIPLLVRYPYGRPSGIHDIRFENRLLFNMVLEQAGVISRTDRNTGVAVAEKYNRYPYEGGMEIIQHKRTRRAVFFDRYKFISSSDGANELYDLENDPGESHNLIKIFPREAEEGRGFLRDFIVHTPDGTEGMPESFIRTTPQELEQLRDLGYLH